MSPNVTEARQALTELPTHLEVTGEAGSGITSPRHT